MTQPQATSQVVAAYQQQTAATRTQLAAFITALWASLGVYRAAQMADFIAHAVPVVEGAMQHMQAITAAYLATLDSLHGGTGTPVAGVNVGISDVRNGANPDDVYGRPFHLVWRQLAANQPLDGPKIDAAIQAGADRAVQTAVTDVQLAKTHTAKAVLSTNRNITGYRRHLEGAHSCALCIVASTRRYHLAELMPIHPACDCSVVPVFGHGGDNAAIVLDPETLAAAHDTVAQQFGADSTAAREIRGALKGDGSQVLYRDVLITHDHGELGPVLAVRGADFAKVDRPPRFFHDEPGSGGGGEPPGDGHSGGATLPEDGPLIPHGTRVHAPNPGRIGTPPQAPVGYDQISADLLAPPGHPYRYFTANETTTAMWLSDNGVAPVSVAAARDQKTPDAIVPARRLTLEMKSTAVDATGIRSAARRGRGQSRRVVVDGRPGRMTPQDARHGIAMAVRDYGLDLQEIVVIISDGTALFWFRDG